MSVIDEEGFEATGHGASDTVPDKVKAAKFLAKDGRTCSVGWYSQGRCGARSFLLL